VADYRGWKLQSVVSAIILLSLVVVSVLSSCIAGDGELDEESNTQRFSVNDIPETFEEVLLLERELSGGAIRVILEVAPPDEITATPPSIPREQAHIHLEAQIRYMQDVLGGRVANEFVPYLNVQAHIVNDLTGEVLDITLRPHVGIEEGLHYAANVILPGDAPTYSLSVAISGPQLFDGSASATSVEGKIVTHSDITDVLEGSVLDADTTITLDTSISLASIIAGDATGGTDDDGDDGAPEPAPEPDPYAG
jgi:uncharacterized protein involved in high-affinity Fe2+ transport